MAAKNVNIVDTAQAAPKKEVKPPTYGELCGALQVATNAFLYTHIQNILSELISEPTTVEHILVNNFNNIAVNIGPIMDLLAPYAVIDTLATEHIAANNWNNNELYTPEITRARFAQNAKHEKFPKAVIDQHVELNIFRNHTMAVFNKKAKKAVKQNSEEANKILGQLGRGRSKTTGNSEPGTARSRSRSKSKSRSRSRSKTPNPNRSRSKSQSGPRKGQKRPGRQNQNQGQNQQQQQQPEQQQQQQQQRQQKQSRRGNQSRQMPTSGDRIPFGEAKQRGLFSFTFNGEHWVWNDNDNKYVFRGAQNKSRSSNNRGRSNAPLRGQGGLGGLVQNLRKN
jgi:hypothetical protein